MDLFIRFAIKKASFISFFAHFADMLALQSVEKSVFNQMKYKLLLITATLPTLLFAFLPAQAHDADAHCQAIKESVTDAAFDDAVTIECTSDTAILKSNTYPDHPMMTGIVASNEQTAVPAANYDSPIPMQPTLGSTPQTRDAALGVAVNGVPIYDYTGGGEMSIDDLSHHQEKHDTILTQQLDSCGGHAGRGDDYHYHTKPTCMIEQMPNAGPAAIIGWAFDGFPIYGDLNPDGSDIALDALDVCNGQADETFGYRYHTSASAPYIIQCLMGKAPDMRSLPRVAPLQPADGGQAPAAGFPPRGGVEDLVFTTDDSGLRSMTYRYNDEDYYINYRPSETENCYEFETRTVTNNGELYQNVLCRKTGKPGKPDKPARK